MKRRTYEHRIVGVNSLSLDESFKLARLAAEPESGIPIFREGSNEDEGRFVECNVDGDFSIRFFDVWSKQSIFSKRENIYSMRVIFEGQTLAHHQEAYKGSANASNSKGPIYTAVEMARSHLSDQQYREFVNRNYRGKKRVSELIKNEDERRQLET